VGSGGLEAQNDVLAQPTRARLFARLASLGKPAGTDELARELGLHPSGVRVHLERLHRAGLISRERISQPLGRPRDSWSIAPDALPGGQPPDAYSRLARWLARSIPSRPARLREIERAGRELGHELFPARSSSPPQETLGRMLTALGFAPRRGRAKPGHVIFRLGNCPYREAVRENQPVVCALHRGVTRGLLDGLAPSARIVGFVPKDPVRAGCLIEIEGIEPCTRARGPSDFPKLRISSATGPRSV
jgi:predicted ArsR family transcriptional regulator